MTNLIFKLRVLHMLLANTYEQWRDEVWRRNLDSAYCCDGRECGCQATSVRELYGWHLEKRP